MNRIHRAKLEEFYHLNPELYFVNEAYRQGEVGDRLDRFLMPKRDPLHPEFYYLNPTSSSLKRIDRV